jgi:beta-lactamase superfamily II metal-dependent hydrolase
MSNLKIIQAEFGDCLLLSYKNNGQSKNMLIDGGPRGIYKDHLKKVLTEVSTLNQLIDFIVLSHIDSDHISGLLDLLFEIEEQRDNQQSETVQINEIWANTFDKTIGANNNVVQRFQAAMASVGNMSVMSHANVEILGINQGNKLRIQALKLGLDINQGFVNNLVTVDGSNNPIIDGELKVTIVGPNEKNLEELREEWIKWLDKNEDAIMSGDVKLMANADTSKPNLSSIMFLAEINNKTILLTGDGRSDHLYESLESQNLLTNGKIHVNYFKMPHHGSSRNMTREFLKKVTADTYIFSANGKHGNPDLATLIWVVESAKERGEQVQLILTNATLSSQKLIEEYPMAEFGYNMTIMPEDVDHIDIPI